MVRLRVGPQGGAITLRSTPGVSCALAVSGPGAWVRHRLFQPLSGIAGAAWLFVGGAALAASTAPPVDLELVAPDVGPHAGPTPGERDVESEGRRPRWAIGVLGGVSVGALPAAQPGAEVAIAWLTERLRLEIAGRSDWSHQRVALASRTDEGADFRLLSGLARGCYSLSSSRFALGACAVFELNWLRASGFGATPR